MTNWAEVVQACAKRGLVKTRHQVLSEGQRARLARETAEVAALKGVDWAEYQRRLNGLHQLKHRLTAGDSRREKHRRYMAEWRRRRAAGGLPAEDLERARARWRDYNKSRRSR